MVLLWIGGWTKWPPDIPSNPNSIRFCDLWQSMPYVMIYGAEDFGAFEKWNNDVLGITWNNIVQALPHQHANKLSLSVDVSLCYSSFNVIIIITITAFTRENRVDSCNKILLGYSACYLSVILLNSPHICTKRLKVIIVIKFFSSSVKWVSNLRCLARR